MIEGSRTNKGKNWHICWSAPMSSISSSLSTRPIVFMGRMFKGILGSGRKQEGELVIIFAIIFVNMVVNCHHHTCHCFHHHCQRCCHNHGLSSSLSSTWCINIVVIAVFIVAIIFVIIFVFIVVLPFSWSSLSLVWDGSGRRKRRWHLVAPDDGHSNSPKIAEHCCCL